jgi:hypothetical protein
LPQRLTIALVAAGEANVELQEVVTAMKVFKVLLIGLAILTVCGTLAASGPAGVYAIVERVIIEPSAQSPERVQVWGAFAFVAGGLQRPVGITTPKRGYIYFTVPPGLSDVEKQTILKEWSDLNAVAGRGQAIAFGDYRFPGAFGDDTPIYGTTRGTGPRSFEVRVQPESRKPTDPIPYVTGTGIVRLPATGSHSAAVQQLKDSLKR